MAALADTNSHCLLNTTHTQERRGEDAGSDQLVFLFWRGSKNPGGKSFCYTVLSEKKVRRGVEDKRLKRIRWGNTLEKVEGGQRD